MRLPLIAFPLAMICLLLCLIMAFSLNVQSEQQMLQAPGNTVSAEAIETATLSLEKSRVWLIGSFGLLLINVGLLAWLAWQFFRHGTRQATLSEGQTRQEQAAILKLLDEMAPLANGDLRVKATVSEAKTGALADAFNHAVSELRWLVDTVSQSSAQVTDSVQSSRLAASQMARACSVQAREVHRSSNYLSAMSATMAELSMQSSESSRMATLTANEAESAARAVDENANSLGHIRDEANMTMQMMQRLLENTQAIDAQVAAIRAVAKRTDLLALNTTIRASADALEGPSGSGDLSRLADEVSDLAAVLGTASRDIISLTRSISDDANVTARAMQETNQELARGLVQAEQAQISLESIRDSSRNVQALIADMAERAVRQSSVVNRLNRNMSVINKITKDTSLGVQHTAMGLDELQEMAQELKRGVADFRLPPKRIKHALSDKVKVDTAHHG